MRGLARGGDPVLVQSGGNEQGFWNEADDEISFADIQRRFMWLVGAFWRGRWLVLAIVFVTVVLAAGLTLLITPRYTSTASVQIDQQTERVLGTEDQEPAQAYQDADRFLQTNVEVLKSRATAVRVAQSLNLLSGDKFIEDMGAKLRIPDGANPDQVHREKVLELLEENLSVDLPVNSRVASISFKSPDPKLSAQIANAFAENFITGNLQRKFNSTSYARTFLEKQLVPARERLEASERAMIAYAREAGLIDTSGGEVQKDQTNPNSTTLASLVELNNALSAAMANRIAAQERLRVALKTPAGALPEVYSNLGLQNLVNSRAEKQAELQDELKRHKDDFPTVIQARAQLAELDRQIQVSNENIRRSLKDQYSTAQQQEQALFQQVEAMKLAALSEKDRSVQYNTLHRDVDSNRAMFEALLQRYKEVSAASGIAANNISIIDRAEPSLKPTSPKLLLNLALAFVLGSVIALITVLVRELFDDRVQTIDDAERKFGLPTLGVIPQLKDHTSVSDELTIARSAISEAYQSAATAVLLSSASASPKVLMLTSAQPGEGKSSSTIGLASAFARLNKRTLLIECDLRRPSLKDRIGEASTGSSMPGLCEYLARQASQPTIHTHPKFRFDYILAGAVPPDPIELLGSPMLAALLSEYVGRYDQIVLDGPPILGLADAPILASRSDGMVFVVEANRSHRGRAKSALARARKFDAPIIGTILTKMPENTRFSYGYDVEYYSYN